MNRHSLVLGASLLALSAASSAYAQSGASAPVATADASASTVGEIVVYGQGQTRQVQTVIAKDIGLTAPGTSPLKVVAKLPGVNFQSADPYGAYEWSTRISVRGFNQNQLGFTLDDVPLGDMSYGNYNGLHISRAISSENIGRVELSQGTGGLDTASSSNLGGTLRFYSIDPSAHLGGLVAGTYGSYDSYHGFARFETGDIGTGGRAYVSYGFQQSDKWKGLGLQKQQQVNAKFVQPVGPATFTGFLNYSDRRENDYQDMSLALIDRLGYKVDNISGDFALATLIAQVGANRGDTGAPVSNPAAGTVYPAPYTTVDDVYFNASGLRKDTLGGLKVDWTVIPGLEFKATGYAHHNEGQGLWYTPYVPTPGGAPISIRTTEYDITRYGVVSSLAYTLGINTIEGGFWYENNDFNNARRFYGLDATGLNRTSLQFQTDPFFTQWEYAFNTKTYDLHLQDTVRINDALKLNFGFKSLDVKVVSTPLAGSAYGGEIESKKNFLPQAGVNWRLSDTGEIFADYAMNMRAFVGAATSGPFSTTPTGFAAIQNSLKPETSQTGEIGYRLNMGPVQGVIAGYYVKFKNRLLAVTLGSGIVGAPSALQNVGGVTSKGIELTGRWRVTPEVSLVGSYSYDDSTYDDDSVDGSGVVTHIAGKTVVDTPKHIANASAEYDNGSLFGDVGVSFMSRRFYTYTNDASVPSRALVDASLGWRFHGNSWIEGLEIQGNVTNLLDKKYIATVGSNGFVNSDPAGTFATLLPGSPRELFISVRKKF